MRDTVITFIRCINEMNRDSERYYSPTCIITMWFSILCLLITVTIGQSVNGIKDFPSIVEKNEGDFDDRVLKEFDGKNIPISLRESAEALEDIAAITKGNNLIILRDLKLAEQTNFGISWLNSTLNLFSTRLGIDVEDLVFSGKIYINKDPNPAGNVRYTLKNVKGSGFVGLDVTDNGSFVSTNYFINYSQNHTELEFSWKDENSVQHGLDGPQFSENESVERQLRAGIRSVINSLLKYRLDDALAKIFASDIFGIEESEISEAKTDLGDFYNDLVDDLLIKLNKEIERRNLTEVELPDLDMPLSYEVFGFTINGQVLGSEGWLGNLATFVRRGPISLSIESLNFIIFGSLGLTELRPRYDVCSIKAAGITTSGDISGQVGSNSADLAIQIDVRNRSISLRNFEITDLSDITVRLTGLGPLNWLASKITANIIDSIKNEAIPTIEQIIKDQVNQALANITIPGIVPEMAPLLAI